MIKQKILEENGFSKSEAIVYLALLKLGKTKSGEIIHQTSLQSSVVHNSLNTLINKGFATYTFEGKIKKYQGASPKVIQGHIDSKKKDFDSILPELESLEQNSKEKQTTAKVYGGFKGLLAATLEMIKDSNNGDYKFFAAESTLLDKDAMEFFEKIDLIKKDRKIEVKGIAEISNKSILKNYKNSKIRYTTAKIPPAMNLYEDKVLIISLSEKPVGILIESKEISKQYQELWDSIWKQAKP